METLQKICLVLTIIGAIVWGVVGLFDYNIVEAMLGVATMLTRAVYVIIGLAGLINIGLLFMHID